MKLLENKWAVVTGASKGIGKAIALKFAEHGANIIFTDLKIDESSEELKKELQAFGVQAKAFAFDVSDFNAVKNFADEVIKEFGAPDIFVNNAGISIDNLILRLEENQWDKVINVNLKSMFNTVKNFAPAMLKKRKGSIINMASVVGVGGNAGQSVYSASKAGVIGFTKSIAKEVGSRNIRCNAIAPGFIETDMTAQLDAKIKEEWIKMIPLRRAGTPEDVANTALFLASDLSTYITGEVIMLNGAMPL
ncbi:MAG: 3-oxoacyl-[acyl-carrier-protein] reductase [Bacteroidales bacterium]|nr:3-oxoacyl-[acyl-carrier-protein] reductase [Bacteroidales bacterium]